MFSTGTLVIILLILKVISTVPNFAGIFKSWWHYPSVLSQQSLKETTSGKVPYSK